MSTSFLPYEPNQTFLLPPSPSEWLAEDHLVYFVARSSIGWSWGSFMPATKETGGETSRTIQRCWSRCWCTGMPPQSSLRASWRESFTRT